MAFLNVIQGDSHQSLPAFENIQTKNITGKTSPGSSGAAICVVELHIFSPEVAQPATSKRAAGAGRSL